MKNKAFFSLLFLMVFSFEVSAQNLVPNYSFESYTKCVNGGGEFNGYVTDWIGQGEGDGLSWCTAQCPDTLPKYQSVGVPYNDVGFQYAHTGVSYALVYTYIYTNASTGPAEKNFRNYVQIKLIDSLKAGISYYLAFFVSLSDSSNYACNDIGAYISDSALNLNGDSVKYYLTPQVANNSKKQELSDTMNWMKITGSFVAKGGEKYVILGNFKNDSLSSITYLGPNSSNGAFAYYYIDDGIVSPDSAYADSLFASVPSIEQIKTMVQVFPNPAKSVLNIEIAGQNIVNENMCLFNSLGQNIGCYELKNNVTTIAVNALASGIYFYRIEDMKGNLIASDKVVIMH